MFVLAIGVSLDCQKYLKMEIGYWLRLYYVLTGTFSGFDYQVLGHISINHVADQCLYFHYIQKLENG